METIFDTLQQFSEGTVKSHECALKILGMLYGFGINLEGDFGKMSSAFAYQVNGVGTDLFSLKAFVDTKGEATSDGGAFKVLSIVAGEPGSMQSLVIQVMAKTPLMNMMSALMLGMPFGSAIPNQYIGLISSVFTHLLLSDFTEATRSRASQVADTLRMLPPCANDVQLAFGSLQLSPSFELQKMLAVLIQMNIRDSIAPEIILEIMRCIVQTFFGPKRSDSIHLDFMLEIFGDINIPELCSGPVDISEEMFSRISATKLFTTIMRFFENLQTVMKCVIAPPTVHDIFIACVMRFRTGFYDGVVFKSKDLKTECNILLQKLFNDELRIHRDNLEGLLKEDVKRQIFEASNDIPRLKNIFLEYRKLFSRGELFQMLLDACLLTPLNVEFFLTGSECSPDSPCVLSSIHDAVSTLLNTIAPLLHDSIMRQIVKVRSREDGDSNRHHTSTIHFALRTPFVDIPDRIIQQRMDDAEESKYRWTKIRVQSYMREIMDFKELVSRLKTSYPGRTIDIHNVAKECNDRVKIPIIRKKLLETFGSPK